MLNHALNEMVEDYATPDRPLPLHESDAKRLPGFPRAGGKPEFQAPEGAANGCASLRHSKTV